jgi:uncharacterized protein
MTLRVRCALAALALVAGLAVTAVNIPAPSVGQSPRIQLTANDLIPISPQAACPVAGDLEGVFGPNQMPAYLQCIVPIVDGWLSRYYPGMPHPSGYYFIPPGVTGIVGAPGICDFSDRALQYCPLDAGVYLGARSVWEQYSRFGDAAPPTVISHEVTHHIQNMRGIQTERGRAEIPVENQADCGAGAFMAYSRENGLMARDDIVDLAGSLAAAGSAEGADRNHGTIAERLNSFDLSYTSGLPVPMVACNAFFPSSPLI